MQNFTLPIPELCALMNLTAGDKEVRSFIKGVHVEINSQRTIMVATNGHIMGVFRCDTVQHEGDDLAMLIPSELLRRVLPKSLSKIQRLKNPVLICHYNKDENAVALNFGGIQVAGTPGDRAFPDWRRLFPDAAPTSEGRALTDIDIGIIHPFTEVAKVFGLDSWNIRWNPWTGRTVTSPFRGEPVFEATAAPVVILGLGHFAGLCMPRNTAWEPCGAPAWVLEEKAPKKSPAARKPEEDEAHEALDQDAL